METWSAIRARQNIRQFADQSLASDDLDQILEAGRRAPSSQNWQPWDFIVVSDRQQLVELAKVWKGAGHVARSAVTIALVGPITEGGSNRDQLQYDLGQATMSMMLAAADLGIGSAHAAVADQQLAHQLLDLPQDRFCVYLVAMGYPADQPLTPIKQPDRRPFDGVVHRGTW